MKNLKCLFFVLLLLCCNTQIFAQTDSSSPGQVEVSYSEAEFPGGNKAMYQYIGSNLSYPLQALVEEHEGKVIASFTVTESGKIKNIKIEQSVSEVCDNEVKRVIKKMPKWTPAQRNGKKISSVCNIPFTFRLPNEPVAIKQDSDSIPPQFPGGDMVMNYFIANNLRYPPKAQDKKEQGVVVVDFMITDAGEIQDVKVVKSVSALCDGEAVRVIKKMPKWAPATKNGKPVSAVYRLPIIFKLM